MFVEKSRVSCVRVILALLSGPGGHALRSLPTQNLSPLVSPSEGELAALPSASNAATLDGLGPPSSARTALAAPPALKDNPSLAEFVPMLTQGWAEIFIRRPSGIPTAPYGWSVQSSGHLFLSSQVTRAG